MRMQWQQLDFSYRMASGVNSAIDYRFGRVGHHAYTLKIKIELRQHFLI